MSTTLEQLQYGFDHDSRRTWRQRATTQGWDNAYVYDSLSQIIGDDRGDLNLARNAIAGVPSIGSRWQYDETGNWHGYQTLADGAATLIQSRTHDKGNRLMEVSEAFAMRTDRAGRMTEAVPGPNGNWNSSWTVKWDAWSRIVELDSQGISTAYAYDGLSRRISRYTNLDDVTLHSYYNDEWRPVEERKNSESTAAISYLWGSRHRDDLVRRDRAVGGTTLNETHYVLMDYFNPAAITDESGEVTERYQFNAFGLRTILNPDFTARNDSECAMEFSFQGQFEDVETGWLNYGYRFYLPELGRWACKDPIGERGGSNLYAMEGNDPMNVVDYLGLACGAGAIGDAVSPDMPGGVSFASACEAHDRCYEKCDEPKSNCDSQFYRDMVKICNSLSDQKPKHQTYLDIAGAKVPQHQRSPRQTCLAWAKAYYNLVKSFGKGPCVRARKAQSDCCKDPDNYRCDT